MIKNDRLEAYNKVILSTYDTLPYKDAVDCVMPGYFAGNKVLFVAQNPGQLKGEVEADMKYFDAYTSKDLEKLEEYYYEALKSDRGTYGTFVNEIYGEDWSEISLTNVFKCPFKDNLVPDAISMTELSILEFQIAALKPQVIVAVGAIAYKALETLKLTTRYKVLKCYHPAYLKRNAHLADFGSYESYVEKYKAELQELLQ